MARFDGFLGSTYNTDRVAPADVIAPPYDVVGPEERASLVARSPYNSILVELPIDPAGGDRYEHAAALFRSWHDEGIVAQATEPTLYVYRMSFTEEDGTRRATTGVLGALGLDVDKTGQVLPHEQTISKDKHDRLSLLRAARTNFSPIWGLSLAAGLAAACTRVAEAREPDFAADDEADVTHQSWAVSDPAVLEEISALVGSTPILIADGHHRYETACAYHDEAGDTPGADAVLAFVVELSEQELAVHGIHRLLNGADLEALRPQLKGWFDFVHGPESGGALALRDAMAEHGGLGMLLADGRSFVLVPKAELLEAADDDLDSSRLAKALEGFDGVEVTYQHGFAEVERALADGRAVAAVLLRPVSVEQIARTAHGGRKMPPKSTFFYPKPRTGVVFRELDAR
jgi:uncharacterized protein (DUF1015 family)